jgi:hypothetical protein
VLALILAALIGANAAPSPNLAGVALNATAADVVAKTPGAKKLSDQLGWKWTWKRRGGGVITVWPDYYGRIWRIEFTAAPGEGDSVDLPCVKTFPVQDTQSKYDASIDSGICVARSGAYTLRLRDGSFFEADFQPTTDGQLYRDLWFRTAVLGPGPPLPVRCCIIETKLESNKAEYHVGEPILLRVTFINRTTQWVNVIPIAPYYLSLSVLDPSNKPLSSSGVRGPFNAGFRIYTIRLDPRKAVATGFNDTRINEPHVVGPWREWTDIRDWGYDLTRPGVYAISITSGKIGAIEADEHEFVTSVGESNTLRITIAP